MNVPPPPAAHVELVERELTDARRRAFETLGVRDPRVRVGRFGPRGPYKHRGTCKGCGCQADAHTEDCRTCDARHTARERYAAR